MKSTSVRWISLMMMAMVATGCVRSPNGAHETPTSAASPPAIAPMRKDARLLVPDPTGALIADVDQRLRILDYTGRVVLEPVFADAPVQWVGWAPRGDQLLVITGRPNVECCELFEGARYWLVPVKQGTVAELSGLPQDVVLSWAADEKSLYVLDNWRRPAKLDALGERIQRFDLDTGKLTLLLDRTTRLTSVAELPGGDLLVGQYAGGGHAFYYRRPVEGGELVTAAPFHISLSPNHLWAAEGNLYSVAELAVADLMTGEVTRFQPDPLWPAPVGDRPQWVSDPVWAPDNRWLLYTVSTNGITPAELRFFDRTKAETDRLVTAAYGAWLPGDGPQALVLRLQDGQAEPWRYDVGAASLIGPIGPKVPAAGGNSGDCQPVSDIRISGAGVAYLLCDREDQALVFFNLSKQTPARVVPVGRHARLLSLSADGRSAALGVETEEGSLKLRLEQLYEPDVSGQSAPLTQLREETPDH